MRKPYTLVLAVLLGVLLVALGVSLPAQSPAVTRDLSLTQRIADATKLSEPDAAKFMAALGPAIRDDLRSGKEVTIAGLGTFRVVRVQEHKDLVNGRPTVIPATNTVEFLPEGGVTDAANAEGAKPADTV